ncbi:unnamed protein product [Brassicogethes aeneus]|uniref:Myb/SANT-like DNA-binding domain-containing protein n=1 Tax=Brassicogethes aeneus TaxID=1431903 RepID=A0A9P0FP56_BRAAE|nr:unnamed protein product [Brassicogethes aeneus]
MEALRSSVKKRTTNFREDETKLLIQLWGSSTIQNKLYLTHRKAPVMRLLAANMQQRGFYRTPDEIKTRIRNLKCLYHRIKRSMQSGTGLGTIDPDWPHFKAMDDILTKQSFLKKDIYSENVFEGPRCDDIKQEIDDIDINDDMESYTTNSFGESDYEDEASQMPPLTPAPVESKPPPEEPKITLKVIKEAKEMAGKEPSKCQQQTVKQLPALLPNLTTLPGGIRTGAGGTSLPFPLLILNGLPNQQNLGQEKKDGTPHHQFCAKIRPDADAERWQYVGGWSNFKRTPKCTKRIISYRKRTARTGKTKIGLRETHWHATSGLNPDAERYPPERHQKRRPQERKKTRSPRNRFRLFQTEQVPQNSD